MTAMTLSPSGLSPTEKSKINSIGKNPAKTTIAERCLDSSSLPTSSFEPLAYLFPLISYLTVTRIGARIFH